MVVLNINGGKFKPIIGISIALQKKENIACNVQSDFPYFHVK